MKIKVQKTSGDHQGYTEWIEKFDLRNLPVEDRRTNERWRKIFMESPMETFRTRYGSASAFFTKYTPCLFTKWPSGPGFYLHPLFTKYTPVFFCWFFFRNITELYEFGKDTCFPSVMLRNLTNYVIIPFLAFEMLWNLTDCVTMLPFDFRHVMELHGSCNNALF